MFQIQSEVQQILRGFDEALPTELDEDRLSLISETIRCYAKARTPADTYFPFGYGGISQKIFLGVIKFIPRLNQQTRTARNWNRFLYHR